MLPLVEAFIAPNLGAAEKWVPFHTAFGVHEIFLLQNIHSGSCWNEKQKFLAMFVFRSHCKRDLFLKAQAPLMENEDFWKDPEEAFKPGGIMEQAILRYRAETKKPLLTSAFRSVPKRVL